MSVDPDLTGTSKEESPPFFRSWNVWYALVLLTLATLILLFYLFTVKFQ